MHNSNMTLILPQYNPNSTPNITPKVSIVLGANLTNFGQECNSQEALVVQTDGSLQAENKDLLGFGGFRGLGALGVLRFWWFWGLGFWGFGVKAALQAGCKWVLGFGI